MTAKERRQAGHRSTALYIRLDQQPTQISRLRKVAAPAPVDYHRMCMPASKRPAVAAASQYFEANSGVWSKPNDCP